MVGRRRHTALAAPLPSLVEPDLSLPHKRAILTSLQWAWSELRRSAPSLVQEADEERITERLQHLLNDREGGRRRAHWLQSFETVTRGSKVRSSDGRIEKQPDLHFRPTPYLTVRCASDWAWFVECKIINGGASLRLYRIEGVERFVQGEYAARMPSAAMLGYCRDGTKALEVLPSVLGNRPDTESIGDGPWDESCCSVHRRREPPGGVIDITHLWLAS